MLFLLAAQEQHLNFLLIRLRWTSDNDRLLLTGAERAVKVKGCSHLEIYKAGKLFKQVANWKGL